MKDPIPKILGIVDEILDNLPEHESQELDESIEGLSGKDLFKYLIMDAIKQNPNRIIHILQATQEALFEVTDLDFRREFVDLAHSIHFELEKLK